jgi:hypothetical protein
VFYFVVNNELVVFVSESWEGVFPCQAQCFPGSHRIMYERDLALFVEWTEWMWLMFRPGIRGIVPHQFERMFNYCCRRTLIHSLIKKQLFYRLQYNSSPFSVTPVFILYKFKNNEDRLLILYPSWWSKMEDGITQIHWNVCRGYILFSLIFFIFHVRFL